MTRLTECCNVLIQPDQRYCPKCGWEARVPLPAPPNVKETR